MAFPSRQDGIGATMAFGLVLSGGLAHFLPQLPSGPLLARDI
jgi:hypothetical protein